MAKKKQTTKKVEPEKPVVEQPTFTRPANEVVARLLAEMPIPDRLEAVYVGVMSLMALFPEEKRDELQATIGPVAEYCWNELETNGEVFGLIALLLAWYREETRKLIADKEPEPDPIPRPVVVHEETWEAA